MKRILCYGDSNTWGTIPDGSCAHCDIDKRYAYYLQEMLGKDYEVICEGMPSRTTDLDDYKFPKGNRNGALFFPQCLISHDPIDYVVIMLGTNDLKAKFNRNTQQIACAIEEKYIKFTREQLAECLTIVPQFIVVAPGIVIEQNFEGFEGATTKSEQFNETFKRMSQDNNCIFVSNEGLTCGEDGIHFTEESHKLLAQKLYEILK